ncbi:MAG: hypothetical protein MMC33_000822 [Icmadophila ericetorum]|nr:hypothetical protein [Icmadophila ericetorum]
MTRSDEAEWWFNAVYEAVQQIPHGHVTSYGHIARLLGKPKSPCNCGADRSIRQVGICLKHLPQQSSEVSHHFHDANVPWQRVINAKGVISQRGPGSAARQATVLRQEGVEVERGSLGELTVNFATYGWFPEILPSEEGQE